MNYGAFGSPYSKYSKFGKGMPFGKYPFSKYPFAKPFPYAKPFGKGFPATKGYNSSFVVPTTTVVTSPYGF